MNIQKKIRWRENRTGRPASSLAVSVSWLCEFSSVFSFRSFLFFFCENGTSTTLFQPVYRWFESLEMEAMLFLRRRNLLAFIASLFVIHCTFQNVASKTMPIVVDSNHDTSPQNILLLEEDKGTKMWTIDQESRKQEKTAIVEIAKYFDDELFLKFERAEAKRIHSLVFAVKQKNIHVLEKFLLLVSDPLHPHYAQYKTKKEVEEMTANPVGRQMVLDYLLSIHGVNIVSETASGEYITASATIGMYRILTTVHLLSLH